MADDVDREWFIAAAFRVQTAADALWNRVQRYHAELLRTMGLRPPEVSAFDREYFRQKMAEARQRRHDEHMRHVGEMLADRSEPLILDDPPQLDAIPGLAEALDGFVGSPIPVELLRAFIRNTEFDLDCYQQHIMAHVGTFTCDFEDVPALVENQRQDRIFRFIAMIFLSHNGRLHLWQEADRIRVRKRETDEQGQGIPDRVAEAA